MLHKGMDTIIRRIYTRVCSELSVKDLDSFKQCRKARHSMAREIFVHYTLNETSFTLDILEAEFGWEGKTTRNIMERSWGKIYYQSGYKGTYNNIKNLINQDLITMTPSLSESQTRQLELIKQVS